MACFSFADTHSRRSSSPSTWRATNSQRKAALGGSHAAASRNALSKLALRPRPTGCVGRWRSRDGVARPTRARPCTRRPTATPDGRSARRRTCPGPGQSDGLPGVQVVQHAALGVAGAGSHEQVGQVTTQYVVAGVATVVAELDVDVVAPGFAEAVPREVGLAVPALHRQPPQLRPGPVEHGAALPASGFGWPRWGNRGRRRGIGGRRRCRCTRSQPCREYDDRDNDQHDQHPPSVPPLRRPVGMTRPT